MAKQKIALVLTILLALTGMYLGFYLTEMHYKLEYKQAEGPVDVSAPCLISDSFNCDLVNSSKWSTVLGVPIALFGMLFYFLVFAVSVFALWKTHKMEEALIVVHLLTFVGGAYSIFLFYIAEFVIGALCPYCLMMYAVNFALIATTKFTITKSYKEMKVVIWK